MSPGEITIDHDATKSARNGHFVEIEVGSDRPCWVVIGSRLAVNLSGARTNRPDRQNRGNLGRREVGRQRFGVQAR